MELNQTQPHLSHKRPNRVKLIFNPGSGAADESPAQMMSIIRALQVWKFLPETFLVEPGCNLPAVIQRALADGIRLFVVCGGDGTINLVASALVGTKATLGIIPTGTQNNVALSLGIPADITTAVAILATGRRIKVDIGLAVCGQSQSSFLEFCSVGLISTLFSAADDIQHGNLARVGDFFSALAAAPPAEMRLVLNGKQEINTTCHVVLVSNMPYIGPHFQVGGPASINDGLLDVLLFADLSKLDLLNYAVQVARAGGFQAADIEIAEDIRIQHYHVRKLEITTNPPMPAIADGLMLGDVPLSISLRRRALAVMVAEPPPTAPLAQGEHS